MREFFHDLKQFKKMLNSLEWVKRRVHFNDKTVLERFEAINVVKNSCINQSTNFIFYFRLTIPNLFLTRLFNSLNLLFKNKNNIFFARNWFFKTLKFKSKINTWNRRIWFIVAAAAVGRTRGFGVNDRPPDSLVPPIIELPRRDAMLKDW